MITLSGTKCCGVGELNELGSMKTPEEAMRGIEKGLRDGFSWFGSAHLRPFIMFTGVTKRVVEDHSSGRVDDYGQSFADFLEKGGMGKVIASEERVNWTKNPLKVWIWHPEYKMVWAWYQMDKEAQKAKDETTNSI